LFLVVLKFQWIDMDNTIWPWPKNKYENHGTWNAITCAFGGFGLSYFILFKATNWFTKILKLIHNLGGGIKWRQIFLALK